MTTVDEALQELEAKAKPDRLEGMARYGLTGEKRLGVSVAELRKMAKEMGQDHALAQALWKTGIPEATILASMVDVPSEVTEEQMEEWVTGFHAWDVCDQVCMNLFEKTPLAWIKIREWSSRDEEFVRRAAFALIACLAWHDKEAPDDAFIELLPIIQAGATDRRNMVKKAVSWALRNVGKRNVDLHRIALRTAGELRAIDSRSARWIAADVQRDLASEATQRRLGKTRG